MVYIRRMTKELTTKQAAELLGVSNDTIARWVKLGRLKARKAGVFPGRTSPFLILASDIERLRKQKNVAAKS